MQEMEKLARYIFTTGKLIQDRVIRVRTKQLKKLGKQKNFEDMTASQLDAILMIHMRNQVSMNELSNLLGVSPPSASVMVDRLVEKGIIERKHSVKDRRKVEISISSKVLDDIKYLEEAIFRSFVDLVEKIGPETTRKWCDVLEKVKPILEDEAVRS